MTSAINVCVPLPVYTKDVAPGVTLLATHRKEILKCANDIHNGLLLQDISGKGKKVCVCDHQLQDHRAVDSDCGAERTLSSMWRFL